MSGICRPDPLARTWNKRLEDQVEELRRAPITEPIPYLYLDATFVDARWARTVENVSALVAYGVGPDGHRQLLGVHARCYGMCSASMRAFSCWYICVSAGSISVNRS